MKWYKHFTDWHTDMDINEGIRKYGIIVYAVHCILREIYGLYYNELDSEGFLKIELIELANKCHTSQGKVKVILDFFQTKQKLTYKIEKEFIKVKIPEFIRLAGAWRIRTQDQDVTPKFHICESLNEETKEIRREEEEKIKANKVDIDEKCVKILKKLNETYGKKFWSVDFIRSRLIEEGGDAEKFMKIIEIKKSDKFFMENRRLYNPHTLFKKEYFEKYLNENEVTEEKTENIDKLHETPEIRKQYFEYINNELASLQVELWNIITKYDIDDLIEELKLGYFSNDIVCVKLDKKEILYFSVNQKNIYHKIFEEIKKKTKIDYNFQYNVPDEFLKMIEKKK
jgi:uncharacterized phage protein (TIGR02220 family)